MNKEIQPKTIKGFTFKEMNVSDLKNHPSNRKFFTEMTEQNSSNQYGRTISSTEEIGESIKSQGIHTPLIVTRQGLILSGNRRYLWACKLGFEKVPCNVVNNDLTLEQEEILIIEYNLLGRKLSGSSITKLRQYRLDIYSKINGLTDRVLEKKSSPHRLRPEELSEKTGVSIQTAKKDIVEMRKKATRDLNVMRLGENGINVNSLRSFKQRLGVMITDFEKSNKKTKVEMKKAVNDFNKKIKI